MFLYISSCYLDRGEERFFLYIYEENHKREKNKNTTHSHNQPHLQLIALDNLALHRQELRHVPRDAYEPARQPVPLLLRQKDHRVGRELGRIFEHCARH